MATDHGWLRNIVHVTLIIGLLFQLYEFVIEVSEKNVGVSTGLFRVCGIIQPPGISLTNGPILKPFEVVIVHSPGFCLVYLDGLHVGNYPSKICHDF